MKTIKFPIFVALIFPLTIWAQCQSDTIPINITVRDECLPLCQQMFITKPLIYGTMAECKKNWNYYSRPGQENYFMMAIMTANGLGGQPADINKAKEYAEKSGSVWLLKKINLKIANSSAEIPISFCSVVVSTPEIEICAEVQNQDIENKYKMDVNHLAKTLPAAQALAAQTVVKTLLEFINLDNYVRGALGQFGGSGAPIWSQNSINIMLNFYINSYRYFINDYSEKFKTTDSAAALDKQLNVVYSALLAKVEQYQKFDHDSTTAQTKQKLIAAERAWIAYKEAFIHFGQLYYANKYSNSELRETISAYLTERRLEELKAETSDYEEFAKHGH